MFRNTEISKDSFVAGARIAGRYVRDAEGTEDGLGVAMNLNGLRVLDLSRVLTGPFCSMVLADLGAEVIKVEIPGMGDDTRHWGPPFVEGESAYFLSVNRNKKSITLNLKKERGKHILFELAKKCDVLLENFSPGVTERLGIDYRTIHETNSRLVYCSISGFGQDGHYRDRPAYDLIIQGMSGLMGITGEKGRPPVRIGVAITDIGAGMYACIAILSCLLAREKTGEGQRIDISLLDGAISWMTYVAASYFVMHEVASRMGSAHPNIVPYQCFEARDGRYFTLAVGNDNIWRDFCKALGLEDLVDDPKFATNPRRVENRNELVSKLAELFLLKNRDELLQLLSKARVPCGPVYSVDELFVDPQVLYRNMLVKVHHPKAGDISQIGSPMRFSEVVSKTWTAPPLLGQHNEEILRDLLRYTPQEINQLKTDGII